MAVSTSAAAGAVSGVLEQVESAAAGWDPIGSWVAGNLQKDIERTVTNPIQSVTSSVSPESAEYLKKIEGVNYDALMNDPVLTWAGETINKTGTAIDNGLRDIGINPDSLKMAIAGYFAPYAVPLLQAAMVKSKGGSWEDAAMGAVASYAAQYVGQAAGNWVGTQVAGAPVTASQAALEYGIKAGSQQATTIAAQNAAAMGFSDLASSQIASQLTQAGVSNMTGQLIATGNVDLNKVIDAVKSSGIVAGTGTLLPQVFPNWNSLPDNAKKYITNVVTESLQGKDPTAIAISTAIDAAWDGAKGYYSSALDSVKGVYDSALNTFNEMADAFTGSEQTVQETYGQLNNIKASYDTKVAQYNNLVQQYNTSGDAGILAQINALKPELENLQTQWSSTNTTYQNQLGNYNETQKTLNASMQQIIDSRREYFDTAAQAISPTADMSAFVLFNPDVQEEIERTGKSASQIYFERQMANPQNPQTASWVQGIYNTDPSKIGTIDDLYKQATGFDLAAGTGNVDPLTWSVYQDKVAGSAPWYLAEAEKAKQAGDFTKYSQLMGELNQTYSGAYGESLGYSATDKPEISSNFLKSMLGSVLQQKAQQVGAPVKATSGAWSPTVTPTSDQTKLVRSYGFGVLNPYVTDLMTKEEAANSFLRDKYVYDPLAVENRLSNITTMDFSNQQAGVLDAFKSQLPDAFVAGDRMFLPKGLQQDVVNQFNSVGTSGYNSLIGNTSALDYLKGGAAGGLGSYFKAFDNPYAVPLTRSAPVGGLSQVASSWGQSSGVSSPLAQNMLTKNLIS